MNRLLPIALIAHAALPAQAETRIWSSEEALQAANNGQVILLDIRSAEEWDETGVAAPAWPVSMHSPDFGKNIRAILSENPGTPIALICATGGRSNYLAEIFRRNDIPNVIDVSEGMMGSAAGAGWLKKGLPILPRRDAEAAIPKNFVITGAQ